MKRILLIGGDESLMLRTERLLRLAGYLVMEAREGQSGIEIARSEHPDLIISDVSVPGIDGFGILHLLQKDAELNDIPFVFLTEQGNYADFRRGMDQGADDFFAGDFNGTDLLRSVEIRLKRIDRIKESMHRINQPLPAAFLTGENALQHLFSSHMVNSYKRKQIIFRETNQPHYLYYVQKGKVKGYKTNEEGKELTVVLYGEGDFIGFTALFEESTYHITAEALDECDIVLIPKEDFFRLIHNNPAVAAGFIRMLAKNNNRKAEQMVQLAYDSLRKRTATALLLLQEKFNKTPAQNFHIRISREELAHLSGTTTESLIRTLSDFKAEHLISINAGDITILNAEKLRNMLN